MLEKNYKIIYNEINNTTKRYFITLSLPIRPHGQVKSSGVNQSKRIKDVIGDASVTEILHNTFITRPH